ncbi:MAG TPA: hypothetical protein VFP84_19130, partial [Kofleriaceae bacterium]|nr:hypothetical protein [Kofleriaceae bacterium]
GGGTGNGGAGFSNSPPDIGLDGANGTAGGGGGGAFGIVLLRAATLAPGANRTSPIATQVKIDLR